MKEWRQLMEKHAVQADKSSLTVKQTNKTNPGI